MAARSSSRSGSVKLFSLGCLIGAALAVALNFLEERILTSKDKPLRIKPKAASFERPFSDVLIRKIVDYDELLYGSSNFTNTEADVLFKYIKIICVVFLRDDSKTKSVKDTWGSRCNDLIFVGRPNNYSLPVIKIQAKSSWHFLCETLRILWNSRHKSLHWALFVHETQFAIPENLRLYVSAYNYRHAYYMGHAVKFFGGIYNVAQAGYVLSRGAVAAIQKRFNSSEACISGGKYWKNEDFYLGKHLGSMGIYPEDTRDHYGRGRFHGYNFNQLLFPGKISAFGSYWTRSLYPMKEGRDCCSDYSITFHGTEPDKIYQHNYLIYRLKVFSRGGKFGNQPAYTPFPEESVWQNFLVEEGLKGKSFDGISSEEFYNIWRRKISDPLVLNSKLKKKKGVSSASYLNILKLSKQTFSHK
ncbi:hypothetical protein J437_LFUL004783 [Ladona fulva]|uniref:Uncharacterized protein n=1 Tax=Ladona fulva TaxID=123851 RepID=A0A8K0K4I2_LADFU|nr:hypothetical protein J437_LFUL004783 [Ladona fulva]